MKLSKYIITTSIADEKDAKSTSQTIIYSCLSNQTIVVTDDVFRKITNGDLHMLDKRLIIELQNSNILISKDKDEIVELLGCEKLINDNISLFLNLVESCQSGCNSCSKYYDISKSGNEFVSSISNFIEHRLIKKDLKTFLLTWKVDDPIKYIETILSISISNLKIADEKDLFYSSSLICQGIFLTEEVFKRLFNLCSIKKFHISLECSNSEATESTITNILSITENFPFLPQDGIIFEVNIKSFDIGHVIEIIDRFSRAEAQNRITFKFDFLENDHVSKDILAENEIECLFYAIENGFIQSILPTRVILPCAAADHDSVSVDKDGNLFSCNVLPLSTPDIISDNLIGNINEDFKDHSPETKFRKWLYDLGENMPICYNCNLLPVCGGGCLLEREEGVSLGCPSFKYNIEDRLLISYLNQKSHFNECIIEYYQ